jgi:hypothetical protein
VEKYFPYGRVLYNFCLVDLGSVESIELVFMNIFQILLILIYCLFLPLTIFMISVPISFAKKKRKSPEHEEYHRQVAKIDQDYQRELKRYNYLVVTTKPSGQKA